MGFGKSKEPFASFQASILRSLESPYIVQYVESGNSKRKDVFWFVMEILVGDALDEWLEKNNEMSELDVVKVGSQIRYAKQRF